MPTYRIAGLTVAAERELPGAIPIALGTSIEDVSIRWRPVVERLDAPTEHGTIWEMDGERLLLCIPELGRMLAVAGHTLDVEPTSPEVADDMLPFVLGTGVGSLLHQRGRLVLHAATVAEDGRAYAICGPSGAGKSTLAAALAVSGSTVIADDVTAISLDGQGRPLAWPDGRQLKLFAASIDRLGLEAARGAPVRSGLEKFYVDVRRDDATRAGDPLPLAGVYVLSDESAVERPGIEPLRPVDGAQTLLDMAYRPRLARAMAQQSAVATTAGTVRHAAVCHLVRPRGLGRLDETMAMLRAHWRELAGAHAN